MYRIESMYQIEEKGMKTRNHGFSRLLIQVNKRYKKYAQKNKYICKHCAFHLPMESLDRIESLIDSGTWSPTDENMVSIDMRFLDPHRRFFQSGK